MQPRVVIIGGGFAGLYAARNLRRAAVRITLVDRRNFHLFQPLLYQVATAALNPSDIASPIRSVLRAQRNTTVLLGEVVSVDPVQKRVHLADGALDYDYLVLATGASHSYFGHEEWARHAPGLKTIEDALEIRRRILLAFEAAERETDPQRRAALLTFVVIGAGPTGVELAGALSEIARSTMIRDFRNIDSRQARVILLEGQDRVLPAYPGDLSEKARRQLEELGVEVLTGALVTAVNSEQVQLGDCAVETIQATILKEPWAASAAGRAGLGERTLEARTVLWAAGVQASPLTHSLGVPLDHAGRVIVNRDLTIPGHDEVFVVGDTAAVARDDGTPVPGVAPAAIQEGIHVARNIERAIAAKSLLPFRYRDKGSLATIGRAAAVAHIGPLKFGGFAAWFAWLTIHIFFLIGFRNRFLVLLQWAWAYVTYQRGARLITGDEKGRPAG